MTRSEPEREQAMIDLAAKLMFTVEKHDSGYSLCRDADLPTATRADDLTLDEAEELLETWKLRGFHGG